jgi:hypothetical protein
MAPVRRSVAATGAAGHASFNLGGGLVAIACASATGFGDSRALTPDSISNATAAKA